MSGWKKWECIVCGWVYDEAKGWPEDGIEPGTRWEDIPEDWLCPDCGVGKEDFEMIEIGESEADSSASAATQQGEAPIIVIGSGLSGYNLVKEFRKLNEETPITILTADDGRNYSKPMLSTGFTKEKTADDLSMGDAGKMAEQLKASIRTFTTVTAIDTNAQTVSVGDETLAYSKLVIAWGSECIQPPLKGDALHEVYSVNDLMDYGKFRDALEDKKKVAIIGAGLIGCEFTNDLANGGFEIEAVDPMPHVLPTLLPEACAKAVQTALEDMGAKFHFGPFVEEVNHDGHDALDVKLSDGKILKADIVVSAIGVRPRIQLAKEAGIDTNRGVIANRLLETSAPNVYTFGDCAEVDGHVLFYVLPLMASARALAKTLNGEPTEVHYGAMPVQIKTPACPVVVSPPAKDAEGEWQIEADGNNVKALYKDSSGNLLGYALTGNITSEKMTLTKELPPIMD